MEPRRKVYNIDVYDGETGEHKRTREFVGTFDEMVKAAETMTRYDEYWTWEEKPVERETVVSPVELDAAYTAMDKAWRAIGPVYGIGGEKLEAAQARFYEMNKLYNKAREAAHESVFPIDNEAAFAVSYVRRFGYGVSVVSKTGVEHFGPYKTAENARRYAGRKHAIDFTAPIASADYEKGLRVAADML